MKYVNDENWFGGKIIWIVIGLIILMINLIILIEIVK